MSAPMAAAAEGSLATLRRLAIAALGGALALSRSYAILVGILFALVSGVALYSGLAGAFG